MRCKLYQFLERMSCSTVAKTLLWAVASTREFPQGLHNLVRVWARRHPRSHIIAADRRLSASPRGVSGRCLLGHALVLGETPQMATALCRRGLSGLAGARR